MLNVPNEGVTETLDGCPIRLNLTCFLVLTTSKGVVTNAAKVPEPRPETNDAVQSSEAVGLLLFGKYLFRVVFRSHS